MSASSTPPEWSDIRRVGPPVARYQGTLLAGGVLWLMPLVFLPAAVLSLGRDLSFAGLMAVMGLVTAAPLLASWRQTVDLFPRHLATQKWGRTRTIAYADIEAIRSGRRAQSGLGSRAGLIEQRYLDVRLRDGETITFIEMARHEHLAQALSEGLAAFREGNALGAAVASRGGRGGN
jgi:hypothetical protein